MANTNAKTIKRYGNPVFRGDYTTGPVGQRDYEKALGAFEKRIMVSWDIPADINKSLPCLPNKLYCNKDLVGPLEAALRELIAAYRKGGILGKLDSLVTFDGCYNIRNSRGLTTISNHAWAIAVDFNAFRNGLGELPTFSKAFAAIFKKHGFEWGGDWTRKDGMHFQLDVDKLPPFCPCA